MTGWSGGTFPPFYRKINFDFISWVRLLCASTVASVHKNGLESTFVSTLAGDRTLCHQLYQEERFEGITWEGTIHKLSLYADDLLL